MAYPKQFTQISFLHVIRGTDEVAQTAIHVTTLGGAAYDAASVQDEWLDLGEDVADAYGALWVQSDLLTAQYADFVAVKFAAIGVDGLYLTDAEVYELPTPQTGGASALPPQATVVVSLRTGTTFGDANYGRMYLPYTMGDLNTTYQMSGARAGGIAAVGANFVNVINGLADDVVPGAGVVNLSRKGSGTVKGVSRVGCGRLTDTQRRRREQLDEDTQFADV